MYARPSESINIHYVGDIAKHIPSSNTVTIGISQFLGRLYVALKLHDYDWYCKCAWRLTADSVVQLL